MSTNSPKRYLHSKRRGFDMVEVCKISKWPPPYYILTMMKCKTNNQIRRHMGETNLSLCRMGPLFLYVFYSVCMSLASCTGSLPGGAFYKRTRISLLFNRRKPGQRSHPLLWKFCGSKQNPAGHYDGETHESHPRWRIIYMRYQNGLRSGWCATAVLE